MAEGATGLWGTVKGWTADRLGRGGSTDDADDSDSEEEDDEGDDAAGDEGRRGGHSACLGNGIYTDTSETLAQERDRADILTL